MEDVLPAEGALLFDLTNLDLSSHLYPQAQARLILMVGMALCLHQQV